MSEKTFDCVIDTHSKEERKKLIDYLTDKDGLLISNIDDYEGYQVVGVSRGQFTILGIIDLKDTNKYPDNKYLTSVEEFISACEAR